MSKSIKDTLALEALEEVETRLTLLIDRDQHKLLDVVARDKARKAITAIKQAQAEVMANMTPPATARDKWMYEQGRLAERDPRTHAIKQAEQAQAPVDACEVLSTVMHFIPETEPELMKDVSELCHRLRAAPKQADIDELENVAYKAWQDLTTFDVGKVRAEFRAVLAAPKQAEPVGINGLTEAETSATMSVKGLSKPTTP
jgi:hypothetical protein